MNTVFAFLYFVIVVATNCTNIHPSYGLVKYGIDAHKKKQ